MPTIYIQNLAPNPSNQGDVWVRQTDSAVFLNDGTGFNTQIPTSQQFQPGAWTSWTPSVSQNGARTSTNTRSVYARYGHLVTLYFRLTVTQAGSAGSAIMIGNLPVTPADSTGYVLGSFIYFENSGPIRVGSCNLNSSGISLYIDSSTGAFGANPSYATVSGDIVEGFLMYDSSS